VSNSDKQISLNLSDKKAIINVSNLGNVHTLDLSGCRKITDISSLRNVNILNLSIGMWIDLGTGAWIKPEKEVNFEMKKKY
jgi:hypothetical protein